MAPLSGSAPRHTLELDLLLACARWPQNEHDREQIRAAFAPAAGPLDLDHLLSLVQHHRLVPLVFHNMRASLAGHPLTPQQQSVLDQLGRLAAANAYGALRSLAELRRLTQELEAAGIPVKVLKGIPLAQTVFGDLSLRAVGDLDLLVPEHAILQADTILRDAGYRGLFQVERFTSKRLAFYRAHWKDIAYGNLRTGYEVDLHWRCFRNREMPGADLCAASGQDLVDFGSFHLATLPRLESLLYLCVHGTLDGWLYLKSLADIGASVRTMTEPELSALAGRALQYRVLPELSAALHLARRYFGMDGWSADLLPREEVTVAHILRFAEQSLEKGKFLAGRTHISAGSMMVFELGLRRTFRYRRELLLRVLFRARMWETIPLPDFLFGIYPLLSPFEWVVFRVRQWIGKASSSAGISI